MEIFDRVMRKTKKKLGSVRLKGKMDIEKKKKLEYLKVKFFDSFLAEEIKKVYKNVPDLSKLHPFYQGLLEAYTDIDTARKKLGRLRSTLNVLSSIRDEAFYDIQRVKKHSELYSAVRKYFGRVGSVLKRVEKDLEFAKALSSYCKRFPKVKIDVPTVVLAGYPNVGKSTLLKALTGSEPKIAPYPFTTQDIMIGYFEGIQVIDTPGVLDRPFEKMKPAEKKAFSAIKYLADLLVFIFDPTQPMEPQRDLLTSVKKEIDRPIIEVFNKCDIVDVETDALKISALTGEGVEKLAEKIKEGVIRWRSSSRL